MTKMKFEIKCDRKYDERNDYILVAVGYGRLRTTIEWVY